MLYIQILNCLVAVTNKHCGQHLVAPPNRLELPDSESHAMGTATAPPPKLKATALLRAVAAVPIEGRNARHHNACSQVAISMEQAFCTILNMPLVSELTN